MERSFENSTSKAKKARKRKIPTLWTTAGVFCLLYVANVLRLHYTLPDAKIHQRPVKPPQWSLPIDKNVAFWNTLREQLAQREAPCDKDNQHDHLRSEPSTLLQALDKKSNFLCDLPSACPMMLEEPMVAVLLVIYSSPVNWRQMLITVLKLLETVDEVWVLIAQSVWDTDADNDDLYRERFRPKDQSNNAQFTPLIVDQWATAVERIDQDSDASGILWLEADGDSLSQQSVWKPLVTQRIAAWRQKPVPLHVSHVLELPHEKLQSLQCHLATIFKPPSLNVVPAHGTDLVQAVPQMHGMVHDRSWLCFLRHPGLQQVKMGGANWRRFRVVAAIWMAHLAGTTSPATQENFSIGSHDVDLFTFTEDIAWFGGVALPERDLSSFEKCDDEPIVGAW